MNDHIGLITERLPQIRAATWYRQRFDACPHFMFFLGEAHISSIQHTPFPFGQRIAYAGFSKNRADWYHALEELELTSSQIIQASQKDPTISTKMIQEFKEWETKFYAKCLEIEKNDLQKLSNKELIQLYDELAHIYTQKLNASPLIDGFALSTDKLIAQKLQQFLESKRLSEKFVQYFAILTSPIFHSFLQKEEMDLLALAEATKENPDSRAEKLMEHQRQFFWIQNNYVKDHLLRIDFFEEKIGHFNKDYSKQRKGIQSIPKNNLRQKQALMNELNLPTELRTLLKITDDFNYWQDERKKGTFWATHYFSLLLEEFARRTNYTLEELKYTFPPEMHAILEKKISKKELRQRINYCMILWIKDSYDVTTDMKLIEELDAIGIGKIDHEKELKGFTAQLGKAIGKVKIVSSVEEINKVGNGDVLVAVMTRPDYIAGMRKAIAFVTDEGGITCHAAIMAREMKKPCVIGTKIATKVLKDGDLVEVDANKGIVRKL